jgi:DNA-binding NtrC family response regulator
VSHSTSILVLGDGPEVLRLRQRLSRHFLAVETARSFAESRQLALRCRFHLLILVDPQEPWHALRQALDDSRDLPAETLLVVDKSRADTAVAALRGGASDVLLRPFSTEELVRTVKAICGERTTRPRSVSDRPVQALLGSSAAMRQIRALIERIAAAPAIVLVEGEPGTGKELVARLLHGHGGAQGPFVTVDCSSIDAANLEKELVGLTRRAAGGSTLFLDEIHEMPLHLQFELLRNMERTATDPDGDSLPSRRIVASTQLALGELVARGRFREDLWYRLAAIRIGLPPLRERREDIPLLAAHFVERLSAETGIDPVELAADDLDALGKHDWPGNVRELRQVVEQILLRGKLPVGSLARPARRSHGTQDYSLDWTLEQAKRHHMARVLEACDGNKSAAARRLDISRKTLDRKLGPSGPE